MPAIVHSSSDLALRKVALIDQSVSEQNSGLVTVNLTYIATGQNRSRCDAFFYTDAPPPVWPANLDRGRLLTRNIYMVDRSVEEQNGLVTIEASYAGGRSGLSPAISTDFESEETIEVVGEPFTITIQNPENSSQLSTASGLTDAWSYTYTPTVQTVQYVKVGLLSSYSPKPPLIESMYSLGAYESSFWRQIGTRVETYSKPRQWFVDQINRRGILEEAKTENLTPTVALVTVRYSVR